MDAFYYLPKALGAMLSYGESTMLLSRASAVGVVLAAVGMLSSPARADLVELTQVHLTGQGIGSTLTALTLQSPGSSTTESGGVLFNGTVFGDAKSGASQSSTFTFASLGITSASQLALVVNLSEPGSENPPSVTTALSPLASNANLANAITLNAYSAGGTLLGQFSTAAGQTLDQVAGGVGGSGLVFGLTPAEQTELNNLIATNPGNEVFTVGATFANAQGGVDVIQVASLASSVPEPATWAMIVIGFAGLGFMSYRRRDATFRWI
ncbi:PEP-CTERM sorting domain-containing protein [Bradyrhizobium genosp. P]|uniref:PEP-CTERM sorting domain-containing protein n=1 Tax=Bradyrhizobium genosp. P TaxID=83641 RepID=UPI003CEE35B4